MLTFAQEQEDNMDRIDAAVARNAIKPGSPLEKLVREQIYNIAGIGDGDTDAKLDTFIQAQAKYPEFADSLLVASRPPAEKKPVIDTLNLSPEQFNDIVSGKVQLQGR
jgi:hypothetical protein